MEYYVSAKAFRSGDGTKDHPFKSIGEAARLAKPGDEVIAAPGIYREYVDPASAGFSDARITYRSEEPLAAVITGAEIVKNWKKHEGDTWVSRIGNGIFGDYNPYTVTVAGDWYYATVPVHTGEVYLNGKAMYEVMTLQEVLSPKPFKQSWEKDEVTILKWYTEQEGDYTVIYANFGGKDPNKERVEIQRPKELLLSFKGRGRLYHCFRLYDQAGCYPVGSSDSISGRNGRSSLVKGMDHRGLRDKQFQMLRHYAR